MAKAIATNFGEKASSLVVAKPQMPGENVMLSVYHVGGKIAELIDKLATAVADDIHEYEERPLARRTRL